MSYKKLTIKQSLTDIDQKKVYLPALQRKFVWDKHQIELLFDSLMRNYPFGTFLFWRLHRKKAETYVFYEFLTEYDERSPYNRRKTGAFLHEDIIGVLDGQQRLSSIYIGLMGTHTSKAPYKRWDNPAAFEKKSLFLNLLSLPYELDAENKIQTIEDHNFEFRFWTEAGADGSISRRVADLESPEPMYWFKVGKVLSWDNDPEYDLIVDEIMETCRNDTQRRAISDQRRIVKRGLETLHKRIFQDELINYFEVAKDELEDILKIFVRVNSGGTVLSKTDLLFSTIVATWEDGRDEIERLIRKINAKGDGFAFGNEYLMRCCLMLTDGPVVFKVNSFKSENVERIRVEWPNIADAISKTVDLLVEFGFNHSLLTSQNATLILAYYIYKGGKLDKESKKGMRLYLIHALLNTIYGSSQDQLIADLRRGFRVEIKEGQPRFALRSKKFSFDEILKIELPQQKRLTVTESDLDRFLQSPKGPTSFFLLSLLYPHLRFNEVLFHQDHVHPAAAFGWSACEEIGLEYSEYYEWYSMKDRLPNLQLMEGRQNESKNATDLARWVDRMSTTDRKKFMRDNFFPLKVSLEFKDFKTFYEKRAEVLRKELRNVLAVTGTSHDEEPQEEWVIRDEELGDIGDRSFAMEP